MSEPLKRVLVTGATGNVGKLLVEELLPTGVTIRVFLHTAGGAAFPESVEVALGDFLSPATFAAALHGIDAVFLLWPFRSSEGADEIVDAIALSGARVVFVSSLGVRDEGEADPSTAFHQYIERAIAATDLEWTFLRCGGFGVTTRRFAADIRAGGIVRWPYAKAARALIHERDVAAVAVRALLDDGHVGKKYVLTGPDSLSHAEQVRIIGEVIGRPTSFEESSPEVAREQMLQHLPDFVVDGALRYWAELEEHPDQPTDAVREVTGEPPRTFREWVVDHADEFR